MKNIQLPHIFKESCHRKQSKFFISINNNNKKIYSICEPPINYFARFPWRRVPVIESNSNFHKLETMYYHFSPLRNREKNVNVMMYNREIMGYQMNEFILSYPCCFHHYKNIIIFVLRQPPYLSRSSSLDTIAFESCPVVAKWSLKKLKK